MSSLDIRQTAVAELDDDETSQLVAVLDAAAGAVERVAAQGRDPQAVRRNAEEQLGESPEQLLELGEQYFDLEVQDVATLVGLEWRTRGRNRGSTTSEGPLYAVLEYDRHVVDSRRWSGKHQARLKLTELTARTATGASDVRRAVADDRTDLSDARYVLQQGLRNPQSLPR